MITIRSLLSGTALVLLTTSVVSAQPRGIQLAQAQPAPPAAQQPQAQEENRDRQRGDRRERREERRRQETQAQAPAAAPPQPPAPKLPPVSLPTVNAPQAAAPDANDPRRRGERRPDPQPSQAQAAPPAPPAPPAAAPAPPPPRPTADANDPRRRGERRPDPQPNQAQAVPPAPPPPPAAAPAPAAAAPTPPPPAARTADRREDWRSRRLDDVRQQRTTSREGDRTIIREPGRTIVSDGNRTIIRHDDSDRLRAQARDVRVERRGGDTITTVVRPDGTRIVTVTDGYERLVRRSTFDRGGREVVLFDNRPRPYVAGPPPVVYLPPPRIVIPQERYIVEAARAPMPVIVDTLNAPPVEMIERPYSLDEIRTSVQVRDRMPRIDVDSINFETGSWAIEPGQAAKLDGIANAMKRVIAANPAEVFLIEGHTDAVGGTIDNLSLSDRRAESVAMILTEAFEVPPENLQTQGYGEELLKIQTQSASRENRRVAIRRITPLLSGTSQAVR